MSPKIRWLIATALLCGVGAAFAAPAIAAPRAYDSQMTDFQHPDAVTIGADDQVWVSDTGSGVISQWTPYPSQEKLSDQDGGGRWSSGETGPRGPAVSAQTGTLIAGELGAASACGGAEYYAFDNFGQFLFKDHPGEGFVCMIWLAFDNSPTSDSYGSFYALSSGIVEKRDGYGNPVDFTGTASYISGSTITGTPKGPFGNASGNFFPDGSGITVDSEGNIWVINRERREIDEFDSTGVFIRRINAETTTIPATETPMGPKGFGSYPGLTGVAVDPTTGNVLVSDRGALVVREFSPSGEYLNDITGADTPAGKFGFICNSFACFDSVYGVAVNSQGYAYVADGEDHVVDIFKPQPRQPTIAYEPDTSPTLTSGTVNATVDPNGGGDITSCHFEYKIATADKYTLPPVTCSPDPGVSHFTVPTEVHADLTGLSTETTYVYRVVVGNANATRVGLERTLTPHNVVGLRAEPATDVTESSATLNGSFVGNGASTTYWFEYGKTTSYGKKLPLPAPPGASAGSPSGPGRTTVSLPISGLAPTTRYHFRIVANNGSASSSDDQSFRTSALLPQVKESVTGVHSDQVILNAQVNPGGADTVYNFEYGTEPCTEVPDPCQVAFADTHIGSNFSFAKGSKRLLGLGEGTTYYYRAIATNSVGTTHGPDLHFSTYPFEPELVDTCPNVLARQQTGSALVSDCRGYELVSAAHAGGYDVESTLVPGQTPFDGYPRAENPSRALYGIHNGALPGVAGNPTNRGVDPYVATRNADGWTTSYVGIPANDPNASSPFSSSLAEADATLQNFAFDGPEICSPCFADGSTGIPVHLDDGSLVQGMTGSIPQAGAKSDGLVKKHFSADGKHFVFGSTSQFEPAGNAATGDVSIYDRNLGTGTTQVVSTGPSGTPLACLQGAGQCHGPTNPAGIAELDMSEDGSRILVGQKTSTDAAGNDHFHLYMHVGTSADSIDITPGVSEGVLFDGMTGDGSRLFFTTRDHLVGADTDSSADIYEATVGAGFATLRLISTDGSSASNDDGCEPPGVPGWNVADGEPDCSALAFAGGAGVAGGDGTFYFLSPELLDGSHGTQDQPNLYVVEPGGNPTFVATIDSSEGKPGPQPASHPRVPGSFLSGLEGPESLAVDQLNGDVYVAEREKERVLRFTENGAPHDFTEGPNSGTNELTGQSFGFGGEGEIAVDSASSGPLSGALYVTTNGGSVNVFARSGAKLGELTGFSEACGVAVDESNGAVYVGDYPSTLWRLEPDSATTPITNADYEVTGLTTEGVSPCPAGADSSGHAFALGYFGGPLIEYEAGDFAAGNPIVSGTEVNGSTNRIYTDPENGDRYIDRGERIEWTDPAGSPLGQFGSGEISFSQGVAINATSKHVYVSTGSGVLEYGFKPGAYHPIDNPAIVHAADQAEIHHYGDFQVTPSGSYAAFVTTRPLDSGFLNEGHAEVYRYSVADEALECASCTPTNAPATGDASFGSHGLSITDDGRVFFDSTDALVLRDGDERKDVYEWEVQGVGNCNPNNPNFFSTGHCVGLVSSGTSQFDSSLLSVSGDGVDAYFFTHDSLAHEDENGPVAKLYDARENGGFFDVPPPALCAASDECHGPGTKAAEPLAIGTISGQPGTPPVRCKKGTVKRHGKCVKSKKKRKKAKRRIGKVKGGRR